MRGTLRGDSKEDHLLKIVKGAKTKEVEVGARIMIKTRVGSVQWTS